MSQPLPATYLARHGETAWTVSGQHTGLTDIPLTARGESVAAIGARADRAVARVRAVGGNVLVFSSGHFLRVFVARWLGLDAAAGQCFCLSTASLSVVGYEHDATEPVVRLWNDDRHV